MDWLFLATGRLGYATDRWLTYVKGGYALASIETSVVFNPNGVRFEPTETQHQGWALGGGIEYAVTRNFSLGIEYLHVDLNEELHVPSGVFVARRFVDPAIDVVQVRLNVKLGTQ